MMKLLKNELETLKVLYFNRNATKSEISEQTRLSNFLVSTAVDSLLKKGLVEESGDIPSRRGRPSSKYRIKPDSGYFLGVSADINSIIIVLVDSLGRLLEEGEYSFEYESESRNIDGFIERLIGKIDDFMKANVSDIGRLRMIGMGIPGIVDTEKGIWLRGLRIPGVSNINIKELLQEKYGIEVIIEDVARTVTYYASTAGSGRGIDNFVIIHLGYGVGGGVFVNGEIYKGSHGFAGEIGHMIVEPDGYRCHCGNIGCLETVASVDGILHHLNDRKGEIIVSTMHSHDFHDKRFEKLDDVLEAAGNGDNLTRKVLFDIGLMIGDAVSNIILFFNPKAILITGPNSVLKDYIEGAIWQRVRNRVISEFLADFKLEFCNYSSDNESYGAALLARETYWRQEILKLS